MKAHILLFVSLIAIGFESCAQNIENGCYTNGDNVVCVKNDSIIICCNNYLNCYYGSYNTEKSHIFLGKNILLGKNATIDIEKISDDFLEIRLISKYNNFIFGESIDNSYDTTIYQDVSTYYHIAINNECIYSDNTHAIHIDKDSYSKYDMSNGFLLHDDGRLSCFADFYEYSLVLGNRYIFSQKYYPFRAIIINEYYPQYFELIYRDNKIIQKFSNDNIVEYLFDNSNCDSCFTELKNRFPLLFE